MTSERHTIMATALALAACWAMPAAAQVSVLNGKAAAVSDANSGKLLKIVSANGGGAHIWVRTDPSIVLVCDNRAPATTCMAWVKAGTKIVVALRRQPAQAAGDGIAPHASQWRGDCRGTAAATCTVTMDAERTVFVDWAG